MAQLGINTLMYLNAMKEGTPQSKLLDAIASYFPIAEVRREFIAGGDDSQPAFRAEVDAIRTGVRVHNLTLYYSVPEDFCIGGAVNPRLEQFLKEANDLNAVGMKFSVGDVPNTPLAELDAADKLISKYNVAVTIENDQSTAHGSLEWALKCMGRLREAGAMHIKFCYDCGNWVWAGVDPDAAFDALLERGAIGEYQIKNVNKPSDPGHPAPALLEEGIVDWAAQIRRLPGDVPVTLEYPSPLERIDAEVDIAKRTLR